MSAPLLLLTEHKRNSPGCRNHLPRLTVGTSFLNSRHKTYTSFSNGDPTTPFLKDFIMLISTCIPASSEMKFTRSQRSDYNSQTVEEITIEVSSVITRIARDAVRSTKPWSCRHVTKKRGENEIQMGRILGTLSNQHNSLRCNMESTKDTIETLKDIVSSMEKEIGENRVGFCLNS